MQLFYNPSITEATKHFLFDKEESRHIVKVLRKKENDILHITNGNGYIFEAKVALADIKNCEVHIINHTFYKPKAYRLHMAVAPTKMNDRYEWFLEKATEIGIDEITPIICDHSERKVIKTDRFEKIIQSATKQSLSAYYPKLNDAISFKEFVTATNTDDKYIAHCEETNKKELVHQALKNKNITILIGPEGDFSSEEIQLATNNQYQPVALGESRLRTETAAIAATHTVALLNLLS